MRKGTRIYSTLFCFLLAVVSFNVNAGIEPYTYVVQFKSNESPGAINVVDGRFTDMSDGNFNFQNGKVKNKITLQVDHSKINPSNYELEVSISGQYYTYNGTGFIANNFTKKLKISDISGNFIDKSVFYFEGAHTINATVDNIQFISGSGPVNLILSADIEVERYYDLDLNSVPTGIQHTSQLENNGTIDISWGYVIGAIEYDLEWSFINSYNGEGGELSPENIPISPRIFELNSTRITTSDNHYNIPYTYDKGYILYRVRAVGKSSLNGYTYNLPAKWSADPKITNCENVTCIASKIHVSDFNNNENLNWQYTVSYAEEGKNKIVGSYFDGSLRNRQTVTKLNTDNKILVGETIYDHQGRGAITVLPVPDPRNEKLEYKDNFNLILDNDGDGQNDGELRPYNRNDFDKNENGSCTNTPLPMSPNVSGAANYYSPYNPDLSNKQLYLPDAEGFPFVQTDFMPDNTGRIRAQGGAGIQYQIGKENERITKYYYATPEQKDLDLLFGSEAGVANHFKKNLVKDPNGQLSISYLDMSGKVVATALSGIAPENLHELSTGNTVTKETDLLNKVDANDNLGIGNEIDLEKGKLVFSRPISVSAPETRTFNFSFTGENFVVSCDKSEKDINGNYVTVSHTQQFAGVYDLSVKLVNSCGENMLHDSEGNDIIIDFGTIQSSTDSPDQLPKAVYSNSTPWISEALEPGTYQLVKEITVDKAAMDTYINEYMNSEASACLMDLSYFIDQEMVNASFDGCITEQDCEQLNQYYYDYNPDCDPCLTEAQYTALVEECNAISVGDGYKSKCAGAIYSLMADVSPMGQYGDIQEMGGIVNGTVMDTEIGAIDPSKFPLSVFNTGNRLPKRSNAMHPDWKHPKNFEKEGNEQFHYYDDDTTIAYIQLFEVEPNKFIPEVKDISKILPDNLIEPQYLKNVEDFLANWKPEWAKSLVIYHPEFKHYELCEKMSESDYFDYQWLNMSFSDAQANGYNLINSSFDFDGFDPFFNGTVSLTEGFFSSIILTAKLKGAMTNALNNYTKSENGDTYSIWEAAYQIVHNPNGCNTEPMPTSKTELDSTEWEVLRYLYSGQKAKVVQKYVTWYSIKNKFYNECIGEENFNPLKNGFITQFYYRIGIGGKNGKIEQPCHCKRYDLYTDKTKRFSSVENMFTFQSSEFSPCNTQADPETEDEESLSFDVDNCFSQQQNIIDETENISDISAYKQCGVCPFARDVQMLLDALVKNGKLEIDHPMGCDFNGFVPDLKETMGFNKTDIVDWNVTSGTDRITAQIGSSKNIILEIIESGNFYDFSDITEICCIRAIANPISTTIPKIANGNFLMEGKVKIDPSDTDYNGDYPNRTKTIQIEGSINLDIANCTFDPICTPTKEAVQLQTVLNTLLYYGDFWKKDNERIQLNYPQDVEPTTESGFAYNAAFNQNMVTYFDMVCDPSNPNKNWFYFFDDIYDNVLYNNIYQNVFSVFINDYVDGISYGEVRIDFYNNNQDINFENIVAFGNIKPYDGTNYEFVVTAKVKYIDGSNITYEYFDLLGNISYIEMGSCEVALPSDFDPENSGSNLAYSGYYECAPSSEALLLQDYLNNEFDWSALGNVEYVHYTGYSPSEIEAWLPPYNGYYLNEIVEVSNIAVDQTAIAEDGSSHYFTMIARIVSTDEEGNPIEVSMQLRGFAAGFNIGNCYPTVNLDCNASSEALELMNQLNTLASVQNLDESMSIDIFETINQVKLYLPANTTHNNFDDLKSFTAIRPFAEDRFYIIGHFADGEIELLNGTADKVKLGNCGEAGFTENLVYNGDFEKPLTGNYPNIITDVNSADYKSLLNELGFNTELLWNTNWSNYGVFYVGKGSYNYRVAEKKGYTLAIDGDANGADNPKGYNINWMQGIKIEPNTDYEFSFYIKLFHGASKTTPTLDFGFIDNWESKNLTSLTNLGYQIEIYKIQDNIQTYYSGEYRNSGTYDCKTIPWDHWAKIIVKFNSRERDFINLAIVNRKFAGAQNDYFIDDITLVGETFGSTGNSNFTGNVDFMCDLPGLSTTTDEYNIDVQEASCLGGTIEVIKFNARMQYEVYLRNQRIDFRENYIKEILSKAAEDFTMIYSEGEHQYTLYYYDQAGNLVRTVPPEGVVKFTEDKLPAIRADRNSGTQTLFANHKMVTSYKYNSLNQLVAQSMPDHDNLEIRNTSDYTGESGIPVNQSVEDVQFGNSLNGSIISNDADYGFIYQTNDGGKTWTEATIAGVNDLNAIQYITTNKAFAVGNKGTVIKMADAGIWNLIPIPTTADLVQLNFETENSGMVFEKSGKIWFTSDAGVTWSGPMNRLADIITGNLTDIVFTGNQAVAITDAGRVYGTTDKGYTWKSISNIKSPDLNLVDYSNGIAYATGNDGLILKRETGGFWRKINNTFRTNTKDIHYLSPSWPVMLSQDNFIYYSTDGGSSWTKASNVAFADFCFSGSTGFAVATDGTIYKSITNGQYWNSTFMGHPAVTPRVISFNSTSKGYVGGDNNKLFCGTKNIIGMYNWSQIPTSVTYNTNAIIDVYALSNNRIIVLYDNGTVVITENVGASWNAIDFGITNPAPVTNENIIKLSFAGPTAGLFIKNDGTTIKMNISPLGEISYSLLDVSYTVMQDEQPVKITPTGINDVQLYTPLNASLVGNGGELWTTIDGGITWAYETLNTRVPALRSVAIADPENFELTSVGKAYIVGDAGTVIETTSGGRTWQIQNVAATDNLKNVKFISDNEGVAVGDNGTILEYNTGTWTKHTGSIIQHLNGLSLTPSGDGIAVGVANKTTKENTILGGSGWNSQSVTGPVEDLKAVDYNPDDEGDMLAVGKNGKVFASVNGGSDWAIANRFTPGKMFAMHQVSLNTTYVVGENGLVVKTTDKGQTWNTNNLSVSGADDLHAVYFISESQGVAAGNDGAIYYTQNGALDWSSNFTCPAKVNDIQFVNSTLGFAVGNGFVYKTTLGITGTWVAASGLSGNFNAVHFADRFVGFVVGDNGLVYKTANGGGTWEPITAGAGSTNLTDVHFIDTQTGYILGENGFMTKTINGGQTWHTVDQMGTNNQNYTAFHFTDNYNMVVVGNNGVVEKLYDFSDQYSTLFYYDKLGRLVVSQNAKQFNENSNKYSFTVYDALGRIERVGEIIATTPVEGLYVGEQMDNDLYLSWIENNNTFNITRTYYDAPLSGEVSQMFGAEGQQNLRSRVASSTYRSGGEIETIPGVDGEPDQQVIAYDVASHYSYDIHGNVKTLVQENKSMPEGQQAKRLDYEYDLISGKVIKVSYQAGEPDQFYHKYEYDADNRITAAYTSRDNMDYDEDARYFYYDHGPLARVELGENKVQGIDYAYTLQGWIKGVNSNTLLPNRDIGKDGLAGNNINALIPQDEFGFTLGYNTNDYSSVGFETTGIYAFEANSSTSPVATNNKNNLYNGNIGHMVTAIKQFMPGTTAPQAFAYEYDQLNRIKKANVFTADANVVSTNIWYTDLNLDSYSLETTYDRNGNLLTLKRHSQNELMDNLEYSYYGINDGLTRETNRLSHVTDAAGDKGLGDIGTQNTNNYVYDAIGNLVTDKQAYIANIEWTVSGKVRNITRTTENHNLPDLEFAYDATGNRILKVVKPRSAGVLTAESQWKYTWYNRDASGNIMATYERTGTTGAFIVSDFSIYGSDRLGTLAEGRDITSIGLNGLNSYSSGNKQYELKNHLGNVLATVSGYAQPVDNNSDGNPDSFLASLLTAQNYYPFGSIMPGMNHNANKYRFGFNGKEMDNEWQGATGASYDYGFRIYDPRIAKFLSVDPLTKSYAWWTPYQFAGNTPIQAIDLDGLEILGYQTDFYLRTSHVELGDGSKIASYRIWEDNRPLNREFMVNNSYHKESKPLANFNITQNEVAVLRDQDYDLPSFKVDITKEPDISWNRKAIKVEGAQKYRELKGSGIADMSRNIAEFAYGASQTYSSLGGQDLAIQFYAFNLAFNTAMENRAIIEAAFTGIQWSSEFKAGMNTGDVNFNMGSFVADVMNYMVSGNIDCPNYTSMGYAEDFKNYQQAVFQTGQRILDEQNLNLKISKQQSVWNAFYQGSWIKAWVDLFKPTSSGTEDKK